MTTQQLVIELESPVAHSDPYIHLDSFLSAAAGIEAVGRNELRKLDEECDPIYFEHTMPLEKIEYDGDWIWECSAAMVAEQEEYEEIEGSIHSTKWRKRFDADIEHQVENTQVNISSGDFKNYNATLPYNAARKLMFYFRGDGEKVLELIDKHIPAIGKKTSQGYGRIKKLHLEECSIDSAIHHAGVGLRTIPGEWIDLSANIGFEQRATKPPYWHPENQCMAAAPFQEYGLEKLEFIEEKHAVA